MATAPAYQSERIDHLGIMASACRAIGLGAYLDTLDEHVHDRRCRVDLPKAFFHLQLAFAGQVAHVTHLPVEETLLTYTTFYLSFELGRSFDPAHPIWQTYLEGLKHATDPAQWTYTLYQQQRTVFTADFYGCFYYGYLPDEQAIRIHFINRETGEQGALSQARRAARVQELASMFRTIQATHPQATAVRGGSWLYHLDAYRSLFPPEYVWTAQPADDEFPYLALWGQFLTRQGHLREPETTRFLAGLQQQTTLAGLKQCFPYQVLRPACSIDHFYRFYEPWWRSEDSRVL
jgi:hypothetical protein